MQRVTKQWITFVILLSLVLALGITFSLYHFLHRPEKPAAATSVRLDVKGNVNIL